MSEAKKTLADCIRALRCRKGPADGTTKDGAFWLAHEEEIVLRRAGGDGIGQSAPDITYYLVLRHYRDGAVRAKVMEKAYHQNGTHIDWYEISALPECTTIEEAEVVLRRPVPTEHAEICAYSGNHRADIAAALTALGLPEADPSPDEVAST